MQQLALLWYSLNPLFCEGPGCELEPLAGKLSFLFSLLIPQFGLLSQIGLAPSDCPQGIQAQSSP